MSVKQKSVPRWIPNGSRGSASRRARTSWIGAASAFVLLLSGPGAATTLTDGQATITFDSAVWGAFGLTLNNTIGAAGNTLPVGPTAGEDLLDTAGSGVANPQTYTLNPFGVDVTPDPRRTAPVTSFTYDASSPAALLASAAGNISLAGVSRWTVSPTFGGGQLVFGDYSLAYNSGAARWELSNGIDFPVVAFLLGSPQVTTGPNGSFTVSGDLIGAPLLGALLAGAAGQDFGSFSFTGVPEPAGAVLLAAGVAVLAASRRRA